MTTQEKTSTNKPQIALPSAITSSTTTNGDMHRSVVQSLFSRIARKYELTNDLISLGLHRRWLANLRAEVVKKITTSKESCMADLCGGTGAVTLSVLKGLKSKNQVGKLKRVYLVDFCPEMLEIGQKQIEKMQASLKPFPNITYLCNDVCENEIPEETMDVITMAYGLRNILDRKKAYQEISRLLKEDGSCFILELTKPSSWLRYLHKAYLTLILPFFSYLLTQDKKAYAYLVQSIQQFPDNKMLYEEMENCGLKISNKKSFLFGTCTLIELKKK